SRVPLYCAPLPLRFLDSFPTRRSSDLIDQRLVALNVDCSVAVRALDDLGNAIGPAGMIRRSHLGSAKALRDFPNARVIRGDDNRSEEHTSELQSRVDLVCRLLLEKKKT